MSILSIFWVVGAALLAFGISNLVDQQHEKFLDLSHLDDILNLTPQLFAFGGQITVIFMECAILLGGLTKFVMDRYKNCLWLHAQ